MSLHLFDESMPEIVRARIPFNIASLGCDSLMELFRETTSYVQEGRIRIEVVHNITDHLDGVLHPAITVGLESGMPTIQFIDALDRKQRIEVVGHELVHLLLLYRFRLRLIALRRPRPGDHEEVFRYFINMNRDWFYLLGQIANTTHHRILIDYLEKGYGIESEVHPHLLHHNFCILAGDHPTDMESIYAKGLIAFEYETSVGKVDKAMGAFGQPDPFWKAYHSAQRHFGEYSFQSIPDPNSYERDILSFLGDLGYQSRDFAFFPQRASHRAHEKEDGIGH
jgi:hypothetical protein